MRKESNRLYNLLPSIYRQRDLAEGKSLEALLSIMENELRIIEEDIGGLYDNWFIETCDEWVVPYIGDLVGAKLLRSVEDATISQRAYVGNTIRYRRRKGTGPVLEQLARDVTGWNARAVEFFQLLCTTQNLNHRRLGNIRTPDLRDKERLELLNSPFDTIPHTIDVRNIETRRGYHNIPNVGVFLWRLQTYPARKAPAYKYEDGKYSFSQIGYDIPLFNHPATETSITNFAEEINLPVPIRRNALRNNFDDYYGAEKSIVIERDDGSVVDPVEITVCDLSGWEQQSNGKIAIDPINGRILNPENTPLHVTYYYGFSADMGGGFYHRDNIALSEDTVAYRISKSSPAVELDISHSIFEAYTKWKGEGKPNAIFEILDSEVYETEPFAEEETFKLELPEKGLLVIRSAQEQRPVLTAKHTNGSNKVVMEISGGEGSQLALEGLLIDNDVSLKVASEKNLSSLKINHCTLVPGENTSIFLDGGNDDLVIELSRSICGRIEMQDSEAKLGTKDTIIDGKAQYRSTNFSDCTAIKCFEARIETSTIFGKVNVDLLKLASNSIFTDAVTSRRRQQGCVRFSYLPEESSVPRRYRCQPVLNYDGSRKSISGNVYPNFTSEKYGDPRYSQLHKNVSKEILEGAENEAEMGAFNYLYQSQRISNLQANKTEYLRFGLELGIFLVT